MKWFTILLSFGWISLHSANYTVELPDFPKMENSHYCKTFTQMRAIPSTEVIVGTDSEELIDLHRDQPTTEKMELTGKMVLEVFYFLAEKKLERGGLYAMYSSSDIPSLEHPINQLIKVENAPNLWNLLEGGESWQLLSKVSY